MAAFGKKETDPEREAEQRPSGVSPATIIGPGSRLVGDLFADGDVTVEGRIEGKIRVARHVKIGAGGSVEGEVAARGVLVLGKVTGEIHASERAELGGSAVVYGSVQAPKIIIAEGAELEGNVAMSAADAASTKSEG